MISKYTGLEKENEDVKSETWDLNKHSYSRASALGHGAEPRPPGAQRVLCDREIAAHGLSVSQRGMP